jgi:hypothetical protein
MKEGVKEGGRGKKGWTEVRKYGSTEVRKYGSTEARKYGSTEVRKTYVRKY